MTKHTTSETSRKIIKKKCNTSADTATASNQWSHFKACNKGLKRVSKFETTATLTPAFRKALKTVSASGSQRCQA